VRSGPGTFPEYDPDDRSSNPSGNRPFREVLVARLSRRDVLRGGTVVAAAGFLGAAGAVGEAGPALAAPRATAGRARPLLGFTPVPTSSADAFTVPDGYEAQVLIPWGTPIRSGGPAWRKDASNTAAEQAE
jgi:secreted PhoX family phosphatase